MLDERILAVERMPEGIITVVNFFFVLPVLLILVIFANQRTITDIIGIYHSPNTFVKFLDTRMKIT